MNNGQPPYGDPSAWGQQGQQANPAQYPVQQNPYAQQPYQQPGAYPQQNAYPQQGYQQPMQQAYQQPYQQPVQQSYEPVQTYQQQAHPQQQVYPQQTWQPYAGQPQQNYNQPYQPQQFYGQNQAAPQQEYPQFNQMGQQVQQGYGSGYSGYYSQPQAKQTFELSYDVVSKAILFGVLPVLFILAMIFSVPALQWIFLAGAVGGIVLMWMRDVVSPNMRLTMSMVLGVMAVIALVGALSGAPQDAQNQNAANNSAASNNMTQQSGGTVVQQWTATPVYAPTATPAPQDAPDGAQEQLLNFFYFWSVGNDEAMISLTAPSWRMSVQDPQKALFTLLLNRTPRDDYEITSFPGTDNDAMRTATVKVTIDKNDGRETKDRYSFKVIMKKEDGAWYVDPKSLESNEKETAVQTSASANTTPTQPPLYTGTPSTILYYNANGGSMYHLDPDCQSVGKKYKPMASFRFLDLGLSPYNALRPCNVCGAPIPDD